MQDKYHKHFPERTLAMDLQVCLCYWPLLYVSKLNMSRLMFFLQNVFAVIIVSNMKREHRQTVKCKTKLLFHVRQIAIKNTKIYYLTSSSYNKLPPFLSCYVGYISRMALND